MSRAAFVLGADGGIGGAICRELGGQGLAVLPAARDASALDALRRELVAEGVDCPLILPLDATDDLGLTSAIEDIAASFELVVAVNNVGRGHPPAPLADTNLAEFDAVVAVTFRSVAVAMRAEVRTMRGGAGDRAIVNVASTAGIGGAPGMSAYAAAKHAVVGLTRVAALDEARAGIRVNAVTPGPIESGPIMAQDASVRERVGGFVPVGRMGRPAEVAAAVGWLASPAAAYVTGAVLSVAAGRPERPPGAHPTMDG